MCPYKATELATELAPDRALQLWRSRPESVVYFYSSPSEFEIRHPRFCVACHQLAVDTCKSLACLVGLVTVDNSAPVRCSFTTLRTVKPPNVGTKEYFEVHDCEVV